MQGTLRKKKSKFTEREYYQLYPTGSNSGKFYVTVKVHKLKAGDTVRLHPVDSSFDTASYKLAKYQVKMLSPLSKCKKLCKVQSTKQYCAKYKRTKGNQINQIK